MDERAIKKLAITLIVAVAIIMLFKSMLTRTYNNLNKASAAKKPHVAATAENSNVPDITAANAIPASAPVVDAAPVTAVSNVANVPADTVQSQ